jgi:sialate O-acetylesterase
MIASQMIPFLKFSPGACVAFVFLGLSPASAAVTMPAIFGDHMVLQQELKIPVWGWAAPGEKVTVTLGAQSVSSTADANGDWRVDLPPLTVAAATVPQTMTVAGTNTLTFQDVVVGDVWVASGQSNMEFGIGNVEHGADEIAKANEPGLRLFRVPNAPSLTPQKDIGPGTHWVVCTPENIMKNGGWNGFSAVAYYFGRDIQHSVGYPVGIIDSCVGGTPAQAWTSLSGLQKDPALAHYLTEYQNVVAAYPQKQAAFPKLEADYQAAKKTWDDEVGNPLQPKLAEWNQEMLAARSKGEEPSPQPQPSRPQPNGPPPPDGGGQTPTNLYNGMIAPIIPYGIKGAIWYQGESNAGSLQQSEEYSILFARMINDWREKWAQGDFPFLFVQLACYGTPATSPSQDSWPYLREAQLKTLALPNTGMGVAVDIGNPYDIHPADKIDVGHRLALAAKHVAYGQDLVYSGPIYDSRTVQGNKIVLSFKNVGGGLKIGAPPWKPYGQAIKMPTELTGFGIAGADKNWVWAQAVIEGDKVIVSSDKVAAPVAVRYGWGNTPPVDLYNAEGLPASPFRTDKWD